MANVHVLRFFCVKISLLILIKPINLKFKAYSIKNYVSSFIFLPFINFSWSTTREP